MRHIVLLSVFALTACAQIEGLAARNDAPAPDPDLEVAAVVTPELVAPPPPPSAVTVEDFDTTTEEQRDAAAAAPTEGGRLLGTTVASLGDPARSGFWIETDLAEVQGRGRLVDPATGASVEVELLPLSSASGSRVSLAAMRLLEVGLTDLPTLQVYAL